MSDATGSAASAHDSRCSALWHHFAPEAHRCACGITKRLALVSENPLQNQLLDLITLMPDTQTQELVDYILSLRQIRARRDGLAPPIPPPFRDSGNLFMGHAVLVTDDPDINAMIAVLGGVVLFDAAAWRPK